MNFKRKKLQVSENFGSRHNRTDPRKEKEYL